MAAPGGKLLSGSKLASSAYSLGMEGLAIPVIAEQVGVTARFNPPKGPMFKSPIDIVPTGRGILGDISKGEYIGATEKTLKFGTEIFGFGSGYKTGMKSPTWTQLH